MGRIKHAWKLVKDAAKAWSQDKVPTLSASLSYYTVFSLGPLLLLVLSIMALVLGHGPAEKALVDQVSGLLGSAVGSTISSILQQGTQAHRGLISSLISVVALVLGAIGVFGQLQDALNLIWDVAPKPGRGVWVMIRERVLSLGMVVVICFLLLVSLGASALLSLLATSASNILPGSPVLIEVINFVVSLGVVTFLFALIYKVLPDVKMPWRPALLAALVTGLLFTVGKSLIGLYIGHSSAASAYGAAGSLIVLLLWVYYSAQIVLFGAELVKAIMLDWGIAIEPSGEAVRGNVTAVEQPHADTSTDEKLVHPTSSGQPASSQPQSKSMPRREGRQRPSRWLGVVAIGALVVVGEALERQQKKT